MAVTKTPSTHDVKNHINTSVKHLDTVAINVTCYAQNKPEVKKLAQCGWNTIADISLKQNNLFQGKEERTGVLVVNNGGLPELFFSDLHGRYRDFQTILPVLMAHLGANGVAVDLGDNLVPVYGEQSEITEIDFLSLYLGLCYVRHKFPQNFFQLRGNHDHEEMLKGFSQKEDRQKLTHLWEALEKFYSNGDETQKKAILRNLFICVANLPELFISVPSKTVAAHASLPGGGQVTVDREKSTLQELKRTHDIKFTEILDDAAAYKTEPAFKNEPKQSYITFAPDFGFSREAWELFQTFGIAQCYIGHNHISKLNHVKTDGYQCKQIPHVHSVFTNSYPFQDKRVNSNHGEKLQDIYPTIALNFPGCQRLIRIDTSYFRLEYFVAMVRAVFSNYIESHSQSSFWSKDYCLNKVNNLANFIRKVDDGSWNTKKIFGLTEQKQYFDQLKILLTAILEDPEVTKSNRLPGIVRSLLKVADDLMIGSDPANTPQTQQASSSSSNTK
jgi:hypothetical protein